MASETLAKIKTSLRISHAKLDDDVQNDIDACVSDLKVCGIVNAEESDPLIFNAVKLWCKSLYTDDVAKSAEFLRRYEALKSCLMMAEGYGREADADE